MSSPRLGPVVLSDEERSVLTGWVRRKTSQALALRAWIVLLCAEGGTIARVAEQAGTSRNTVSKWRSGVPGRPVAGPVGRAASGSAAHDHR